MKSFLKSIFNQKGLSMVETIVGAGLLAGVALIGMNQSDLMKKVSRDTQIQQNSIDLGGQITALLMGQDACEANFGGGSLGIGSSVTAIKNEAGLVAFEQGQTYLNNSIKIESMQIVGSASGGNLELKVDYEKQGEFVGMKNFSQRLPLLVETDGSGNIQNCFSFSSSVQNTIRDILAKKLCQNNQGEHDPDAKTCYVRGIDPAGIKCDAFGEGYSLIRITYKKDNPGPDGKLVFMGECAKKFEPKNCPGGWVRSVSSAGRFECGSIANHINDSKASPHNANCGLDVSGGKLVFACSGGGPSECSGCSASPANEICDGNSVNGVDSCGNFCTVEGTKTEGCGGCGECGDPALVCENQDVTDDCGNVCGTGTKTEGCESCECGDPALVCENEDVIDSCGNVCDTGTKTEGCGATCEDDGGQIFAGNCAEAAASGYPNSSGSISSDQCCSGNAQVYAYCPSDNQGEVEVTCGDGGSNSCTEGAVCSQDSDCGGGTCSIATTEGSCSGTYLDGQVAACWSNGDDKVACFNSYGDRANCEADSSVGVTLNCYWEDNFVSTEKSCSDLNEDQCSNYSSPQQGLFTSGENVTTEGCSWSPGSSSGSCTCP